MAEHRRRVEHPEAVPVAQVVDIDFSYGDVQILFDVAFEVQQGEVLALLGTNGAGKSTILQVITGLVTPERGVVRLNGRTITFTSPEQRARLGIEMLPGGSGVFRALTVRDNLRRRRLPVPARPMPTSSGGSPTCSNCSRARASAATNGPATCRAASSRCWRSAASCCTNPSC